MKRYLLLIVLAIGLISFLSSMPYEDQTIVPELQTILANEPFKEQLSMLEFTYWDRTISVEERGYFYFVEFLIRKGAHFFGYGLVGVVLFLFYRKIRWYLPSMWAILSVFIIASVDEIRQRFTPGRTGIFDDVIIDTVGAITCIFLIKIVLLLFKPFKSKKKQSTPEIG